MQTDYVDESNSYSVSERLKELRDILAKYGVSVRQMLNLLEGFFPCHLSLGDLEEILTGNRYVSPELFVRLWYVAWECVPEERERAFRYIKQHHEEFKWTLAPFVFEHQDAMWRKTKS